ncbi:MAG: peptidylprolyl isomerase [Gammaproteobacteria bacterium]|nr:peptidylprolyl isomerase [Gammaproteobacteria bacterium]
MTNSFRVFINKSVLAIFLGAFAAAGYAAESITLDRIVAVVNEDIILESELEQQTEVFRKIIEERNSQPPPERVFKRQVLERMINNKLQTQMAELIGIQISDDRLNQVLSNVAARNGATISELPEQLAKDGVDYGEYREQIREELMLQELRRQEIDRKVIVTPSELEQALVQSGGDDAGAEYLLSHILIAVPSFANAEDLARFEERAQAIHKLLIDGKDFAETAVAYSDGQQALEGGSLGWRKKQELPSIFAENIEGMSTGDVSEPIRSSSGFHIVKLMESRRKDAVMVRQKHTRHILIRTNEIVSEEQAQRRLEDILQRIEQGEEFADLARQFSDDPGSATRGGDLDWANPGDFVGEFELQASQLSIGEISKPFRSEFGWHIVQLLDERDQDVTDDARRNQAYGAIHARKAQEQTLLWMQRLRDEAFMEIRIGG